MIYTVKFSQSHTPCRLTSFTSLVYFQPAGYPNRKAGTYMLDIKILLKKPNRALNRLIARDPGISIDHIRELDQKRRELIGRVESMKSEQNRANKEIGARRKAGEDVSDLFEKMKQISGDIKALDKDLQDIEEELNEAIEVLPNIPLPDVPVAQDKSGNVEVRRSGEFNTPDKWDFEFKNHIDVAEGLSVRGGLDFPSAARMTGSNWPMYRGGLARLEWALVMFFIDRAVEDGRELIIPPYCVNSDSMFASGQFPKFRDQAYECSDDDLVLIPTSEVPLLNMYRGEILSHEMLPLRLASFTPCFRREAGTYGTEERGLIRIHQFHKVEIFSYTEPQDSPAEMERMVSYAESVVDALGLPYRTVMLATGDLAQQAASTIDIEAWLPGQNASSEVSSVSNCTDYQARRANIRYRAADSKKPQFLHTLNGSALATSRIMVSLIEHYQRSDGGLDVPEVLQPYMNGLKHIAPKST